MTEEAVYEHFDYAGKKISEVKCTEVRWARIGTA